jgi:hypothetical protein
VILAIFLYAIAVWFSAAALAFGIGAANVPGRRRKALALVLAAACLGVALVQVLAAGGRT